MTFQKKSQATVECMNLKFQISNLGCRCSFARQQYVDSSSRHRRDEIVQGEYAECEGRRDRTKSIRTPVFKE